MKKILFIALVSVFALQANAQFTRASLQASGLTCSMCNKAIYNALKKISFISSVESDIKHASFHIVFKENTPVEIDQLKEAVEDAGFSVADLKLTGNFNNVTVTNDKHVVIGSSNFHFLKVNDQVLNGERTITVVDKGFLAAKNFRKYSTATKLSCIQTGKAGSCCEKEGVAENTRVYHVTI